MSSSQQLVGGSVQVRCEADGAELDLLGLRIFVSTARRMIENSRWDGCQLHCTMGKLCIGDKLVCSLHDAGVTIEQR